jgi:hypothetical protein
MSSRRISKDGIVALCHLSIIDRIPYFDIRHSKFIIRYSLFLESFYRSKWKCWQPVAVLNTEP